LVGEVNNQLKIHNAQLSKYTKDYLNIVNLIKSY